ncbi:MAG TPA: hypothetical protein VJM79_03915 [Rhizorhapis sp.]|nr:hypothetical protein [Rhizorhapis sp.]
MMIDLSPQPQDKSSGAAELHPGPRHDATPADERMKPGDGNARWRSAHDRAEAAVQRLSRWAGPAALIIALGMIGWLVLG